MIKRIFPLLFSFFISVNTGAFSVETAETAMASAINAVRAENSLPPLAINWEATRVAKYKCEEMARLKYSAHFSPVYGDPADMLNKCKIPFVVVGENLSISEDSDDDIAASNKRMAGKTLDGWMRDSAYGKNILNAGFRELGVGYFRDGNGNSYWVALFIS
jgi:uncharacterized protein YkwD